MQMLGFLYWLSLLHYITAIVILFVFLINFITLLVREYAVDCFSWTPWGFHSNDYLTTVADLEAELSQITAW